MNLERLAFVASLLLALTAPAGAVHEELGAHTQHIPKTIVLDNDHIQPSRLEMAPSDSVVFENHSPQPMIVRFTDPPDLAERIRCGLVRKTPNAKSEAPWLLFAWSGKQLVATIPPGRFASVCSFTPGDYAFTAARLSPAVNRPDATGILPEKGQIAVK